MLARLWRKPCRRTYHENCQARLGQARASRGLAYAALCRQQVHQGVTSAYIPHAQRSEPLPSRVDAVWELDFFGDSVVTSNRLTRESGRSGRIRDAQVTLIAEVAQNYLALAAISRDTDRSGNLAAQRHTADITPKS